MQFNRQYNDFEVNFSDEEDEFTPRRGGMFTQEEMQPKAPKKDLEKIRRMRESDLQDLHDRLPPSMFSPPKSSRKRRI